MQKNKGQDLIETISIKIKDFNLTMFLKDKQKDCNQVYQNNYIIMNEHFIFYIIE